MDDAMTGAEKFAAKWEAEENFPSYSHSMVERYCSLCVPVAGWQVYQSLEREPDSRDVLK